MQAYVFLVARMVLFGLCRSFVTPLPAEESCKWMEQVITTVRSMSILLQLLWSCHYEEQIWICWRRLPTVLEQSFRVAGWVVPVNLLEIAGWIILVTHFGDRWWLVLADHFGYCGMTCPHGPFWRSWDVHSHGPFRRSRDESSSWPILETVGDLSSQPILEIAGYLLFLFVIYFFGKSLLTSEL